MKILAFETASGRCSVCITGNIEILATETLFQNSMQAEHLTSMVNAALLKAGLGLEEIDYVATTNGPGSFTGIRIGLAACLGLIKGLEKNAVIVSNFSTINYRIREQYRNFDKAFAIIDASRQECYFQIFDKSGQEEEKPSIASIQDIRQLLSKISGKIVIAGSGAKHFIESANHKTIILPRFSHPDARIICKLARNQILRGNSSNSIEPLYIRKPDAKLPA
mgnify:CR=1 FL=1